MGSRLSAHTKGPWFATPAPSFMALACSTEQVRQSAHGLGLSMAVMTGRVATAVLHALA